MEQKVDRNIIGAVFVTRVVGFIPEMSYAKESYYFEDTEGLVCHVPFELRGLVKVNDFVICRVCQYKEHRYDPTLKKIVFDGKEYVCSSVQAYGTEKEIMELWNADEIVELKAPDFIKEQAIKAKELRNARMKD